MQQKYLDVKFKIQITLTKPIFLSTSETVFNCRTRNKKCH